MYPFRSPRFPMQIPNQQQFFPPQNFSRMAMGPMNNQPSGLGGLFSKLLGGNRTPTPVQGMPGMRFPTSNMPTGMFGINSQSGATGLAGMLKNGFSSAGGLPGMLDNVQRVMGVAQQFGPMVQQYGPFIKNMPAMFKIMKEINNSDSGSNQTESNAEIEELPEKELPSFEEHKETDKPEKTGQSIPKLFI